MNFPLSLFDFGLWLATTAIIILITTETLLPYLSKFGNVTIERRNLRIIAVVLSLAFMAIVVYYSFTGVPKS